MKRIRLLARFEVHLLLFALALAFFLKPILLPRPQPSAAHQLLAFFVPWAALIALLFLMARAAKTQPPQGDEQRRPPDREPRRDH
jgi:hypothetical protein